MERKTVDDDGGEDVGFLCLSELTSPPQSSTIAPFQPTNQQSGQKKPQVINAKNINITTINYQQSSKIKTTSFALALPSPNFLYRTIAATWCSVVG
jgi:hypothetical protein